MTKKRLAIETEIANDKSEKIMDGVAAWCSFYRSNPQRFVKDYLNINLKLFQKILIYEMMHNNYIMYVAARGQGKTYLTSIFCVVRCILYPKTKIVIASSIRSQANLVLSKIIDDLMNNYDWGSENLKREIIKFSVKPNEAFIDFANGSSIKVATASDTSRGLRANILVVDEFWLLDLNTISSVLEWFLTTPRQPNYLNNPKYKHLIERNKEIYMGSAWLKSHWAFDKARSYMSSMMDDKRKYFICGLPYQISIKEGLLSREQIEDKMNNKSFNETQFSMEMESLWLGNSEGAYFKFDDMTGSRKLQTAIYPPDLMDKGSKIPDLVLNERRILSIDIALMSSKKHKNDATSIIINSAIPKKNNTYSANIIYLESIEGVKTEELAIIVRRLFDRFKCTDLVVDTGGQGLGVYDILCTDIIDYQTGEIYPALSCCNDKAMAERCSVEGAKEVIWSIKASASFNTQIAVALRNGFESHNINLLVSEMEAEELLKEKIKNYTKLPISEQVRYKMPYIQTSLLIYEIADLECEMIGTNIKITEKSGKRKDRYSSLAYNYWVQCQLERENIRKQKSGFDISGFTKCLKSLTHKPTFY